ncbi:hypothetical protein GCM10027040_18230 [Halomonas shantousis]
MLTRLGTALLLFPLLLLLGLYFWELNAVRTCLFEGGQWDYLHGVCVETPQPFSSFFQRHPLLVNAAMLTSALGLVMCMAGFLVRRR